MEKAKQTSLTISQSLIKDVIVTNSIDQKEVIKPSYCPRYLKFKYIDKMETSCSDVMLSGQYFEWHLLGATRSGIEPILPRINVKDLRPTKSASKSTMYSYIMEKAPDAIIVGTGNRMDLKPKSSSSKQVLIDYIYSKGGIIPEKTTKDGLSDIIAALPEDLGEPEITQEDLFAYIQEMPIDLTEGSPSARQIKLDQVIELGKIILEHMGLNTSDGEKQFYIKSGNLSGHLDWVCPDVNDPNIEAIYDVKWTETKVDDWRNGWGEPDTKEDAKLQATHYVLTYYRKYGVYPPFYFIVFGADGWIKFLRYRITPTGLQQHVVLVNSVEEIVKDFIKNNWPARPLFNRCLFCDFSEVCTERSVLPEIEEIEC